MSHPGWGIWQELDRSVVEEMPASFLEQPVHIQAAFVHAAIGNQIGQRWRGVSSSKQRTETANERTRRDAHGRRFRAEPAPTDAEDYPVDVLSPRPGPSRQEEIARRGRFPAGCCQMCGVEEDFSVLGDSTRHRDLERRVG